MRNLQAYPSSAEMIGMCSQIMQNAMAPDFSLVCDMDRFGEYFDPSGQIAKLPGQVMENGKMMYPSGQLSRYRMAVRPLAKYNKIVLDFHLDYMSTQKETNDLRCFCANEAYKLYGHVLPHSTDAGTLYKVQNYFRNNYRYNNTGNICDHSSVGLLRTGQGVCQAIACLAAVILQYSGIPCLIVTGEGFNGANWGRHMWNAVLMSSGKWEQVDFTFGLSRLFSVPSTMSICSGKEFKRTHRYDETAYSQAAMCDEWSRAKRISRAAISLGIESKVFSVNGERFSIDGGRPLMGKLEDGTYWIDLREIVNLLGGAIEIVSASKELHICMPVSMQRYDTGDISGLILPNKMFNILALKKLGIPYWIRGSRIEISLYTCIN